MDQRYRQGDWVIYRMTKRSTKPGPRAQKIEPSAHGEEYAYVVDKFWVIAETRGDRLILRTRRGKVREIAATDRNLRPARWWERLMYRKRFPEQEAVNSSPTDQSAAAN